jgi:hypothetical protein
MRDQKEAAKPPYFSRRRGGQTGEIFMPEDFAELTTPALRATPPLRGGESALTVKGKDILLNYWVV